MGWPIGSTELSICALSSTRLTADQMVVSVGPYKFQRLTPAPVKEADKSTGRASPPQNAAKAGVGFQPVSSNTLQVTGVACIVVIPYCAIAFCSARPSIEVSREAMTTRPPVIKGKNISRPAISNEIVVTASNVSSCLKPGSVCIECKKL